MKNSLMNQKRGLNRFSNLKPWIKYILQDTQSKKIKHRDGRKES